ncbi:MAG: hypothetical protein RL026_1262 [Pseudomonadota bacterium]|jgi:uncharacterized protein (DUF1330 family)
MAAYIVFMRDTLRDQSEMDTYLGMVPPTLGGTSGRPLALYGKLETLEGAPIEGAVIAAFDSYDEALAWYRSPAYQEALQHRLKGGDYRAFITEGL